MFVARHVAERFTQEIRFHPHVEVGGKYVGFIRGAARYGSLAERHDALPSLVFEIVDYLEDGPRADRTPTFHRGDAAWQTAQFRALEARYPEIEQLGSWHSHHSNGLDGLSAGDVRGYTETVNDPGHNHDFFLASLGVDRAGFTTARHYLFIRQDPVFYKIRAEDIKIREIIALTAAASDARDGAGRDTPPPGENTDPAARELVPESPPEEGRAAPHPPGAHAASGSRPHSPDGPHEPRQGPAVNDEFADSGDAPPRGGSASGTGGYSIGQSLHVPGWSDTPEGRKALAGENRLRDSVFPRLRLSVGRERLFAKGPIDTSVGRVSVSLLYPSAAGRHDGLLKFTTVDEPRIESTVPGLLATGLDGVKATLPEFVRFVQGVRREAKPAQRGLRERFLGLIERD